MEKKVVFIAKTDLNVDGRIINQIKILRNSGLINNLDFILLPDKPYQNFLEGVEVYELESKFRNKSLFRIFTVIDTTIKSLLLLFRLRPDVLHVQDTAVVLPSLIYRIIKGKSFTLIYDDHELPNENESLQYRVYQSLENQLMRKADLVIFANQERMDIVCQNLKLKCNIDFFLNLPYYNDRINEDLLVNDVRFQELDSVLNKGVKFIMHQGSLEVERGREKLAEFSRIVPSDFKILIVGVSDIQFKKFLKEFKLDAENFYFFGTVKYELLGKVWSKCIASIVMYLPTYINNRLCAPNRLYISLKNAMPVIINKDNPVLNGIVSHLECGWNIEEFKVEDFPKLKKRDVFSQSLDQLINENVSKFTKLYWDIILK
ncbi:hypothetical protein [Sphingobacterium detergens]|uniref:Glycosyltransferase involved in cell wall biosynthesis n=1 Tax=Sphingobacterium detergens TaxID=1145106 RepID=A0A420ALS0_SPHD1|nr:hypothetical protein [Sphingobacterium detergens]RKE45387.1 hypothetical protein DFQ12_4460 [Sphingobacterium detergens]